MISIDRKKINTMIDFIFTYDFSSWRKPIDSEENVWDSPSPRSLLPIMEGGYLGKILVDHRLLDGEQFDRARRTYQDLRFINRWKSLGALLVEMALVTSQEYLHSLAEYFQLPIVSLRNFIPSPLLQKLVGEGYAQKNRIVVLGGDESEIRLALADPDPLVMEELMKMAGPRKKVRFALADPVEVENCFRKSLDPYGANSYR